MRAQVSIGFSGALFLLFLGLRLTGHIDWAWYWVASPLLVVPALALALAAVAVVCFAIVGVADGVVLTWRNAKRKGRH